MTRLPYTPEEDEVLEPFITRPVTNWGRVLPRLPNRSFFSARSRLRKLRDERAVFRDMPRGGAAQNWRESA